MNNGYEENYEVIISFKPRFLDTPNSVSDEIRDLLILSGFRVNMVTVNTVVPETTYGIGEEESEGEFDMWLGPVLDEKECLSHIGRSNMSVIVRYGADGSVKITHKWSPLGDQWMECGK